MFGFHPHACPKAEDSEINWFSSLHDRSTTLHFAFGNCMGAAGPYYSSVHVDVYMFNPDVYVDNFKLIDYGHLTLLEDPKLREEAKKFGDPDYLLTEKPLPEKIQKLIDFEAPAGYTYKVAPLKGFGD